MHTRSRKLIRSYRVLILVFLPMVLIVSNIFPLGFVSALSESEISAMDPLDQIRAYDYANMLNKYITTNNGGFESEISHVDGAEVSSSNTAAYILKLVCNDDYGRRDSVSVDTTNLTAKDGNVQWCETFIKGENTMGNTELKGLINFFELQKKSIPDILQSLGYVQQSTNIKSGTKTCFPIIITSGFLDDIYTNRQICLNQDSSGNVTSASVDSFTPTSSYSGETCDVGASGYRAEVDNDTLSIINTYGTKNDVSLKNVTDVNDQNFLKSLDDAFYNSSCRNLLNDMGVSKYPNNNLKFPTGSDNKYLPGIKTDIGSGSILSDKWTLDKSKNNQTLTPKSYGAYSLSNAKKYVLYYSYLFDDNLCDADSQAKSSLVDELNLSNFRGKYKNNSETKLINTSSGQWEDYYIGFQNNKSNLNIPNSSGGLDKGKNCNDIISLLSSMSSNYEPTQEDIAYISQATTIIDNNSTYASGESTGSTSSDSQDAENAPSCYSEAKALGWLICAALDTLGSAANTLYDQVARQFLMINASVFDGDSPVLDAWSLFRNLANIVFIILLLIVIFSQITGFGIDNYGIKKILPKLIITAILINLSYIVCQLAVDVSNIFGGGLKGIFEGLASNITPDSSYEMIGNMSTVDGLFRGLINTLGVVGAAGGAISVWHNGPAFIIPLLMGVLVALISILFIFILLGVRQAAVILLVTVSPVAVVCYLLPNTKKVFDRFVKIMSGLLLLYPICGLLVGAGAFASKLLLLTAGGELMAIIAMVVMVAPFLFIPTLLKNSFSALGNVGARIQGIGKNTGKWARGRTEPALRESRFGQWTQRRSANKKFRRTERNKYAQEQYQYDKASKQLKGYTSKINAGETLTDKEMRLAATAARTVAGGDKQAIDDSKIMIMKATNNGANEKALKSMFMTSVKNGDVTQARAITDIMGSQKFKAKNLSDWMDTDAYRSAVSSISDEHQRLSLMQGIAKTMATGEGARNFRAANGFQFQHASDLLNGESKEMYDGKTWHNSERTITRSDGSSYKITNAEFAASNHMTNANELYGQAGSVLDTLREDAPNFLDGGARIQKLASIAEAAAASGQIEGDTTKDERIHELANLRPNTRGQSGSSASGGVGGVLSVPRRGAQQAGNSQPQQSPPARPVDTRSIQAPVLQPTPPPSGEPRALSNDELIDTITHPNSTQAAASRASEELRSRGIDPNTGGPVQNQPPES